MLRNKNLMSTELQNCTLKVAMYFSCIALEYVHMHKYWNANFSVAYLIPTINLVKFLVLILIGTIKEFYFGIL